MGLKQDRGETEMEFLQSFMLSAGNYSCYALQVINIARKFLKKYNTGKEINSFNALIMGVERGFITFNKGNYSDDDNFFVKDPTGFLEALTGRKWSLRRVDANYIEKADEYAVNFWAKSKANADKGIGHFDAPDYHTLQYSVTMRVGKIYSRRIFKPI